MNVLIGSHLSFNVIRSKLTPRLGDIIPSLAEELCHGLSTEIPCCTGTWLQPDRLSILMLHLQTVRSKLT